LHSPNQLYVATQLPQGLVSAEKQIMQSLPKSTDFLVVHRKYLMNGTLANSGGDNLCVLVTCIGRGGIVLPGYDRRVATPLSVSSWIQKGENYKKTISNLGDDSSTVMVPI
jgi:hypothetical protein